MKSKKVMFFFLGWVGMVFYFTQRWIYGPLIPSLKEEFGVSRTALGVVGSSSLWGYMLTTILAGLLSDRFGRKYAVLFGIFGFSFLTALCGLANSTQQIFAVRFVTGMVEAFYFIPLIALTLELFPERPGFYLTFMSSGSSLGWFTGPALAGWLLDLTGNWRAPFLVTGLLGLVVAFLLLLFWPQETKPAPAGTFFDRDILKPRHLMMLFLLSLTATFQIAAEFGFTMWYPVFLKTELGIPIGMAGLIAGMYGIGQFIGRPIMGWVSDKLGYRKIGAAGGLVLALSLALILSVRSNILRTGFTFLAGFTGGAVMGSVWTFTGLVFSKYKGLALGIIVTFGYVMSSLSPITIGYLGDHYSVGFGILSVSVPAALVACAAFASTGFVKLSTVEQEDEKSK
jgi:AAHS family cis,cis-muconate transporter-like MFS transporter